MPAPRAMVPSPEMSAGALASTIGHRLTTAAAAATLAGGALPRPLSSARWRPRVDFRTDGAWSSRRPDLQRAGGSGHEVGVFPSLYFRAPVFGKDQQCGYRRSKRSSSSD